MGGNGIISKQGEAGDRIHIYSNEISSSCFRSQSPSHYSYDLNWSDDSDTNERMIMLSLRQTPTPLVAPSPAMAMAPATESSASNVNALQSRILEVRPLSQVFSPPCRLIAMPRTTVPRAARVTRDLRFVRSLFQFLEVLKSRKKTLTLALPVLLRSFPALSSSSLHCIG